jgi:hypothetical protein
MLGPECAAHAAHRGADRTFCEFCHEIDTWRVRN